MKNKHIIVGVTGGIAAYKAAILVRLLVKQGAEVQVLMTPLAKEFITPLTLATLSKRPILVEFFDPENGSWNSHVDLGLWADAMVIAPATANTMGKMTQGIADNLLLTSYLSARCPVFVAPTMDLDMYRHPATTRNIETLRRDGVHIIEANTGELASGLHGKGRMAEPEEIVAYLQQYFESHQRFSGKKVLITAGPTYEAIDPVRFIGNHSSGKMGYAIAQAFAEQGAEVTLVSGPTSLPTPHDSIKRIDVSSAAQMHTAAEQHFATAHYVILAAAVADFTPIKPEDQKVKRGKNNYHIELQPTIDIAATLGAHKQAHQRIIGFALETHNANANARDKLARKNLDMIVLNSLENPGAGFRHDTNQISIIGRNGQSRDYPLRAKTEVARDILDAIYEL